jgi:hypothetical protein
MAKQAGKSQIEQAAERRDRFAMCGFAAIFAVPGAAVVLLEAVKAPPFWWAIAGGACVALGAWIFRREKQLQAEVDRIAGESERR